MGCVSRVPPVLTYSVLRVMLFVVPFSILGIADVPFLWALLIAFLLSAVVSLFALSGQRDAMSAAVMRRSERVKATMAEREAAEDAWDDEQRAAAETAADTPADTPAEEPQRTDDSGS